MASKRNPLNWRYVGDTARHVLESFSYQYTVRKGGWPVTITGRLTGHMNRVKKWHVWGIPMVNTLKIKKPEAVQNLLQLEVYSIYLFLLLFPFDICHPLFWLFTYAASTGMLSTCSGISLRRNPGRWVSPLSSAPSPTTCLWHRWSDPKIE